MLVEAEIGHRGAKHGPRQGGSRFAGGADRPSTLNVQQWRRFSTLAPFSGVGGAGKSETIKQVARNVP